MIVGTFTRTSLPCRRGALRCAAGASVLLGTALAGAHERAWVDSRGILLAVTAYLLSVFLLWRGLPWHRRPDGVGHARFGAANVVTSLRLSLVIWLLACATAEAYFAPGVGMILVIVLAATLDAIDGPLARASGLDSAYGARFDMETDALLVLVLSVMVWRAGVAGPWVLASGLLRYGFVALAWWLPWMARALPPSLRRKAVCVLQILLLIVALLPGLTPGLATASALIGLLMLVVSFGVDVAWLAARRETSSKPLQGTPI